MSDMQVVVITGMSGAGKTQALRFLEDQGFYCVDNLPPTLIPKFVDLCVESGHMERMALVIDIRGGLFFDALDDSLTYLREHGYLYRILYLEAEDEVLVRRFKETRRRHPLATGGRLIDGIEEERQRLSAIRARADKIINTTDLRSAQLKEELRHYFSDGNDTRNLITTLVSFGFKHGVPLDADLVFDVRFLPNPYYDPKLREYTGTDVSVQKYIWREEITHKFAEKLVDMLEFLIPLYELEGKTQLVIAIGCTGGKHRSVAIACHLQENLSAKGHRVVLEHRDIKITRLEQK